MNAINGLYANPEEAEEGLTPLTTNLFQGMRTHVVNGVTLTGPAIFSVMFVAQLKLWARRSAAPFAITSVRRRVHNDGGQ